MMHRIDGSCNVRLNRGQNYWLFNLLLEFWLSMSIVQCHGANDMADS